MKGALGTVAESLVQRVGVNTEFFYAGHVGLMRGAVDMAIDHVRAALEAGRHWPDRDFYLSRLDDWRMEVYAKVDQAVEAARLATRLESAERERDAWRERNGKQ